MTILKAMAKMAKAQALCEEVILHFHFDWLMKPTMSMMNHIICQLHEEANEEADRDECFRVNASFDEEMFEKQLNGIDEQEKSAEPEE